MNSYFLHPNNCYIYPMANSLRGGAIASEYNVRSLFGVLLSKSSAKTKEDFMPTDNFNSLSDTAWAKVSPKDSKSFNINFKLQFKSGQGNCNGYFVKIDSDMNFDFNRNFTIDASDSKTSFLNLYIYLRIIYGGTGVCDGCYLWAGTKDEVDAEFKQLKSYGFYDLGIELGHVNIDATGYEFGDSTSVRCSYFINNNIMSCIDLDRLGNAHGTFADQLYNRLSRLYSLMIDLGATTIGTPLVLPEDDAFNDEPGHDNHDFNKISPFKLQMYINTENNELYTGGLRYVRYDETKGQYVALDGRSLDEITDKSDSEVNILTFISSADGKSIEYVNVYGDNCRFTPDRLLVNNLDINGDMQLSTDYAKDGVAVSSAFKLVREGQTLRLILDNGDDATFNSKNITADYISANEIHGAKVFGAVWQ